MRLAGRRGAQVRAIPDGGDQSEPFSSGTRRGRPAPRRVANGRRARAATSSGACRAPVSVAGATCVAATHRPAGDQRAVPHPSYDPW